MKKVLIGLVVVIGALLAFIATRPAEFKIERSATMKAPADLLFSVVNDFHRWDEWSPWSKLDPNMKKTFDGPPSGKGAIYTWSGNDDVGEGRMTILDSKPNELVTIKLEFIKPFASTNETRFKVDAGGEQSRVTWTMEGRHDFMGKAFSMFADMDAMVGKDFEKGLAQLKTLVEAEAEKRKAQEAAAAAAAAAAAGAAPQPEAAQPAPAEGAPKAN